MASVRKHRKRPRHWTVEVSLGPDPDRPGKYLRREVTICPPSCKDAAPSASNGHRGHSPLPTIRAKNQAAAKRAVDEIVQQLKATVAAEQKRAGAPTVSELADMWLKSCKAKGLKPSTLRKYRQIANSRIRPEFGDIPIVDVTVEQIELFEEELLLAGKANGEPLKASSVMRVHRALGAMFNLAYRRDLIEQNPIDRVQPPPENRVELEAPETKTLLAFLDAVDTDSPWLGTFARLAIATGARRGELLAIRWEDVSFETPRSIGGGQVLAKGDAGGSITFRASIDQTREVTTTKTRRQRTVPIEPETVAMLKEHRRALFDWIEEESGNSGALEPSSFVFPSPEGPDRPRNPDAVSRQVLAIRKRHSLGRVWLHGMRHWSASAMVNAGVDPSAVAKILGHSSTKLTLDTYAHPIDGLHAGSKAVQDRLTKG